MKVSSLFEGVISNLFGRKSIVLMIGPFSRSPNIFLDTVLLISGYPFAVGDGYRFDTPFISTERRKLRNEFLGLRSVKSGMSLQSRQLF